MKKDKRYTSIRQSRDLLANGMRSDTADGHYLLPIDSDDVWVLQYLPTGTYDEYTVPAWSAGALMLSMPRSVTDKNDIVYDIHVNSIHSPKGDHQSWCVRYHNEFRRMTWCVSRDDDLISAMVEIFLRLKESEDRGDLEEGREAGKDA